MKIGNYKITEAQFKGEEKIEGNLYLGSLTSIPDGFNPTVGGILYLGSLTSIPDGFNPTVGGNLYLGSLTSIPDGFNPTVGGILDLGSLTSIPDGFNPTVGGYLNLPSLTSIPDGFNPTVGGNLNLPSLTSIPDGFNPTVGGYLNWKRGNKHIGATVEINRPIIEWQDSKYVSADGMFTEVLHKKGNLYLVKKIGKEKEFYLVTDGKFHAHGDTLKEATDDLHFKVISEKLKKEPIKADTMISKAYYRIITGACTAGVNDWVEKNGLGGKTEIRADELLPILEKSGAYALDRFKQLITF